MNGAPCRHGAPFEPDWGGVLFAVVNPVEGLGDRLLPVGVLTLSAVGVHDRVPLSVLGPVVADVLLTGPVAHGQSRGVGGAEGGGLVDDRADDRHSEDV